MATLDTLDIKISANAMSAAKALDGLANSLKRVRSALMNTKDGVNVGATLAKSIRDLNSATNQISNSGIRKLNNLSSALQQFASAAKSIKGVSVSKSVAKSIQNTQNALGTQSGTAKSSGGSARVNDTATKIKKIGDETEKAGEKAKKATGFFSKLWGSIKRIALYRAIRSAMKAISEAFSEGLKNAYYFSKQTEGFERLANTLDRIASITYQMKNQLGAFWGEIKQLVLPVIEWLVEKVRAIAEWLTELFAALNGSDTYLWAKYVEKSWDDAADAAAKYKHQLLGIDELNNLSKNNATKNNSEDHSDDFEKRNVRDSWKDLRVGIKELILEIENIVPDFSNFTSEDLENILTIGLFGIAGALLGGVPGAIVGTIGGILLTLGINKLKANGEKEYSKKGVYKLIKPALMSLLGGAIGIKYGGATGALIGASAGLALGLLVQKLGKIKDITKLSSEEKWSLIRTALVGLTGGIIGFALGGPVGGIVGASLAISLDLIFEELHVIDNIKDKITTKILDLEEEWGIDLNRDGEIGYGKASMITVGTKQLDDAFKPNEPTIDYSAKRITLDKIDKALNEHKQVKDVAKDLSVGNALVPGIVGIVNKIIGKDAMGGIEQPGSLFFAGESGPEFVGSMGSSSAVANTGQMTDAIYKAAYMGMSKALQENGGNGLAGFVPATTDDLFIAMRKKASNYNKRTGSSAFA